MNEQELKLYFFIESAYEQLAAISSDKLSKGVVELLSNIESDMEEISTKLKPFLKEGIQSILDNSQQPENIAQETAWPKGAIDKQQAIQERLHDIARQEVDIRTQTMESQGCEVCGCPSATNRYAFDVPVRLCAPCVRTLEATILDSSEYRLLCSATAELKVAQLHADSHQGDHIHKLFMNEVVEDNNLKCAVRVWVGRMQREEEGKNDTN